MALSLTSANPLSDKLPNHISEAFLVTRSKYKNILLNVSLGGGGGGGGARSLKGARREGEIPRDLARGSGIPRNLARGGEIMGGEIPGTPG